MPIRNPLFILAMLLLLIVLAPIPGAANAHVAGPDLEAEIAASRMLSTGPLNVVVFEVSRG